MIAGTVKDRLWPKLETATDDGRRQRSDRSRRRIIEALFDLIAEGNMSPSAVSVAQRAGVGLRTVFRHFEDMDSIYNEMTEELMAIIMPKLVAPYQADDWRDQLMECLDRRAEIHELVFPVRVCMSLRYYQSDFINQQYKRDVGLGRSSLKAILPEKVSADPTLFASLELILSFQTWRRLRQDQDLSVEDTKTTVRFMLKSLINGIAD